MARRIGRERPVRVRTTFLGAHATPPEFKGRSGDYIAEVAGPMLDEIAQKGLADAVDIFCEGIAFSLEETAQVFAAAQAKGLAVKIHAEQLSNLGGAKLAAEHGALSADHLEYLDEAGVDGHGSGRHGRRHPARRVLFPARDADSRRSRCCASHGVPIALATDANPGSSPLTSPLLVMNMACTLFRMTPEEALAGLTRHAAQALGLAGEIGTLEAGKALRPRDLGHRAAGGTRLPHRLQPASRPHLERPMTLIPLAPGAAALTDWRSILDGAVVTFGCRQPGYHRRRSRSSTISSLRER